MCFPIIARGHGKKVNPVNLFTIWPRDDLWPTERLWPSLRCGQIRGDMAIWNLFLEEERYVFPLHWRHIERDGVSNNQLHYCLLNCSCRHHRSKKTSKLRVTGLCAGNSPVTGEFSAQKARYAENVYIWWRHHAWHAGKEITGGKQKGYCICVGVWGYLILHW